MIKTRFLYEFGKKIGAKYMITLRVGCGLRNSFLKHKWLYGPFCCLVIASIAFWMIDSLTGFSVQTTQINLVYKYTIFRMLRSSDISDYLRNADRVVIAWDNIITGKLWVTRGLSGYSDLFMQGTTWHELVTGPQKRFNKPLASSKPMVLSHIRGTSNRIFVTVMFHRILVLHVDSVNAIVYGGKFECSVATIIHVVRNTETVVLRSKSYSRAGNHDEESFIFLDMYPVPSMF